jgi:N-methylhydantoinase A/oxoprolinase/acetone carboxylase beta subunit
VGTLGRVIGVDTGGTFTDVFVSDGRVLKLPSTPGSPVDAIIAGLRHVDIGPGDAVGHGTTVATNAVLERRGARTVLLTTAGFEDVLEIRRQNRPAIYDLTARWPDPLVPRERRVGVAERLDWKGQIIQSLDDVQLRDLLLEVRQEEPEAIAVCFLFSYANPEHEERCKELLSELLPDVPVSLSHRVAPRYGEYERTSTTVINAYVLPVMRRYLDTLVGRLVEAGVTNVHVMHSNGGLVSATTAARQPVQTVLSGPAAGVVGAQALARDAGYDRIITFDMGGTSTDVAVASGRPEVSEEGEIETFPLLVPMLAIETVGAGGGSIARLDAAGGLHVGPRSAGADPGPAAYGKSDEPTVTDANLVLGRLSSEGLLDGGMPLHLDRARSAVGRIGAQRGWSVEETAWAIVRLANSNMERAVRTVTLQRAHDPRDFTLLPFGGAGPLHAAEMADGLGISTILVPPHPGVLAALGLTVPDLVRDYGRTVLMPEVDLEVLQREFLRLQRDALLDVGEEELFGAPTIERAVDMRYVGQSFDLRVPYVDDVQSLLTAFGERYEQRYGYALQDEPVQIVNVRVRVTLPRKTAPRLVPSWPEDGRPTSTRRVVFGSPVRIGDLQEVEATVYWRPGLNVNTEIEGPVIIQQYDSTTLVPPLWRARVDERFNLVLQKEVT